MNKPMSLPEVASAWIAAKEAERLAIQHRRELDAVIVQMSSQKDEGSVSSTAGDYAVKVTFKLDRKLDTEALQVAWASVPPAAQAAVKWKADLSLTAFKNLDQGSAHELEKYITTKPASPSVSVELATKEK